MTYQDIEKASEGFKLADIKGKDYMEVNQRVKVFRMLMPEGTIETEILSLENGVVTMRAIVKNGENILSMGTAQEKEGSNFINKTSFIENCETSAVGRALGFLGIGIDASLASYEEVENAKLNQKSTKEVIAENKEKNDNADKKISAGEWKVLEGLLTQANYGETMIEKYKEWAGVDDLKNISKGKFDALCSKIKGEIKAKNGNERKAS